MYIFMLVLFMIYWSETIGKAEVRRQSKAIVRAGHSNNFASRSELYTQNIIC
jgi:hypothetical protein